MRRLFLPPTLIIAAPTAVAHNDRGELVSGRM